MNVERLKSYLANAGDLLVAVSILLIVLLLIALGLTIATRYVENGYLAAASTVLTWLSLFLSAGGILSYTYRKRQRDREIAKLRGEFESAVNATGIKVSDTVKKYIPDFEGFLRPEITKTANQFWNEFQNKGRIDSDLDFDLTKQFFGMISEKLSLENGQKLFLLHQYLAQNEMELLQRFRDTLNKSNFAKEGTPENLYSRLLTLQGANSSASLSELMAKKDTVTTEEVVRVASESEGHQALVEKIEEIVNDQKSEAKLTSLQRIVKRLVIDAYVSEAGLLSLMSEKDDLIFVMKSEAGVGGLKTVFQKSKETTPFKKVLLAHGFNQVGRASAGTFLISAARLPQDYQSQVPLYMEKVLIPEVNEEWKKLQAQYKFKRLKHVTYSYISFRVKRLELKFGEFNTRIKPDVVDILNPLDVRGTAEALASHIYEIPAILKQMEIDAVVDSGTDSMKLALHDSERQVREELLKEGITIRDVTDYRKVDSGLLAQAIKNKSNSELSKIAPRAKRRFDDDTSAKISAEIIRNATDLFNLVTGLGITT